MNIYQHSPLVGCTLSKGDETTLLQQSEVKIRTHYRNNGKGVVRLFILYVKYKKECVANQKLLTIQEE